jgi:hypothetical protein
MAARPILAGLKSLTATSFALPTSHVLRSLSRPAVTLTRPTHPLPSALVSILPRSHQFHNTTAVSVSQHGEGDRNEAAEEEDLLRPPPDPVDASRSAFLGEADSDDGHETNREVDGNPLPELDASQSAFLGESDSNDAFESEKEVEGDKVGPIDASRAAFLGEGDSNDAFEGDKEVEGDKHEPLDPTISGFHGEGGHDDAPNDAVWSDEGMTLSEADLRADKGQGQVKVAAMTDKVKQRMQHLQSEVDDLKTIMGEREGVERDKFRL